MDPLTLMMGLAAVVFGLTTMMFWRRAADLEERVRELEGKLADTLPAPKEIAKADAPADREEPAEEPAPAQKAAPDDDDDDDDDDGDEEEDDEGDEGDGDDEEEEEEDDEEEEAEPDAKAPVVEKEEAEPEPEPAKEEVAAAPPAPEPEPEPAPKAPEPDPLRLEALKVVSEAFELARYLDFDAIVEKPSTYRVTVPITAANGNAVRYLKDGMFTCLKKVKLEGNSAVLHVDTSKGPP